MRQCATRTARSVDWFLEELPHVRVVLLLLDHGYRHIDGMNAAQDAVAILTKACTTSRPCTARESWRARVETVSRRLAEWRQPVEG